jgi:uncharacterized protein (DUF488 family)
MFATIGYEKCTPEDFLGTLQANRISVLVDIRERAQSRRPGFSKTALSKAMNEAGIEYAHFRALGDPKAGRDAARAGEYEIFRSIFAEVMSSQPARDALSEIENLAKAKRICLMCYERNHHHCHRKIVAERLEQLLGCNSVHLGGAEVESISPPKRRMFHPRQGATA